MLGDPDYSWMDHPTITAPSPSGSFRRRRLIKVWLWVAVLLFVIGCGLAGLHWNGPQL